MTKVMEQSRRRESLLVVATKKEKKLRKRSDDLMINKFLGWDTIMNEYTSVFYNREGSYKKTEERK